MALVDPPKVKSPPLFRVVPTLLASFAAVVLCVVVIAVVARATADDATVPTSTAAGVVVVADAGPLLDAGVLDAGVLDAGVVEAGVVDAGAIAVVDDAGVAGVAGVADAGPPIELVTVSADAGPVVDGGPATVEGPPYEPAAVAAAALVLVEACAVDARRWDPSLGGAFTLRVTLPALPEELSAGSTSTPLQVVADGLRSPVLEACIARRLAEVRLPPGASDLLQRQQVEARASLSTSGCVDVSSVSVVSVSTER